MRKVLFILGVITIVGLSSCKPNKGEKVLVTRSFPTASWERFDYVENVITVTKPLSYDLELDASFDNSYTSRWCLLCLTRLAILFALRTTGSSLRIGRGNGSQNLRKGTIISVFLSTMRFPLMSREPIYFRLRTTCPLLL